jgi:mRNA interferase RelE/StbE
LNFSGHISPYNGKVWLTSNRTQAALLEAWLYIAQDNPHVPGGELHGALAGHHKIKLRKLGYRLVYGVQDNILMVMVMAVDKREDSAAYQSAMARISELIAELAKATPKRH